MDFVLTIIQNTVALELLQLGQQEGNSKLALPHPDSPITTPTETTTMVPPVSYYNTPWGRRNSDFDEASSKRSSSSRSTSSYGSAFSHAPARRNDSPPQSRSPSPHRGCISELVASRIPGGYGQVMKAAAEAGFEAPSRESVREYAERALPPTPTSVKSVDEMARGEKKETRKASAAPSALSAREVLDDQGRVRAVVLRRKKNFLPLAPLKIVPVQLTSVQMDSPTLGPDAPVIVAEGRMSVLRDTPLSPSSLCTRSTVDSSVVTPLLEIEPRTPRWQVRMRMRAHWNLKWLDQYRED